MDSPVEYEELTTEEIKSKIEDYLKEFNELSAKVMAINVEMNLAFDELKKRTVHP